MITRALVVTGLAGFVLAGTLPTVGTTAVAAAGSGDTEVTVGSPAHPFPQNKQNEPAVAVAMDPAHPNVLAAGANEEIDNAPCRGNDCSFTPGVGDSGIYFSRTGGRSWTQPTYRGWSARSGKPGVGPIGTVPRYYDAGLVSDGDPALAFGPRPGPGGFSWANGSRLYYASLASDFPGRTTIPAQTEAITVSRTDNVPAAAAGDRSAWSRPVVASLRLKNQIFSDKEALWADNAASSRYFGNVYVCWTSFRDVHAPVVLARSTDGGQRWSAPVIVQQNTPTATAGLSFCTVRTDSRGRVYVAWENINRHGDVVQTLARSDDGGRTFGPSTVMGRGGQPGRLDPAHVATGDPRFTMDGLAGARTDAGLSLDVANGAPSGRDASDELLAAWSDGSRGLNHERAVLIRSTDRGNSFSGPADVGQAGDRPSMVAVAISPDGTDAYLTYDAMLDPWRYSTSTPRRLAGAVRHAGIAPATGLVGRFRTVHRGAVGDARASSQNDLTAGFLGDYNYVAAGRDGAAAVWNDVRNAAVCAAVDRYRASLVAKPLTAPAPLRDCPPRFGNTDIFGGWYADPS